MTQMVPAPLDAPTVTERTTAAIGLALSLAFHHLLPLRHRVAAVRTLRRLPAARRERVARLDTAVRYVIPSWWPGRIACMEISLATVLATALTGYRASWALGARRLPDAAHAWVDTAEGPVGHDTGDGADRPYTRVLSVPEEHPRTPRGSGGAPPPRTPIG
ncbi:lasso peptide biosynthesis B2 protein [Streptomyces sp. NPDC101490]|uniref:lasso peptide biosynthesis B2 protein n=1 Tax=Streptomyces sp. NPDC101490 TaxID=3366143 RepID=UPI00382C4025